MRRALAVMMAVLGVGCTPSKTASPQASTEPVQRSEGQPAPEGERDGPGESLVVAGPFGIREVGLDGKPLRVLSRTPAQRPRLLPGGSILFVTSGRREIRVFERDTGRERILALLPSAFGFCPSGQPLRLGDLEIQADHDFVVNRSGDAACIRLQDRNDNMMTVAVDVQVQLPGGRLSYAVSYPAECSREKPPIEPCQVSLTVSRSIGYSRGPFSVQEGALVRRDPKPQDRVQLPPGDWVESALSPSRRWVVVEGNFQEGDYIYRDVLLLDTREGDLYRVAEGDISLPLTPQQLGRLGSDFVPTTAVEGEKTVQWLPDGDVLIVGSLLVHPGRTGTDLGGDVAF